MGFTKRVIGGIEYAIDNGNKISLSPSEVNNAKKRWRKQVSGLIADKV